MLNSGDGSDLKNKEALFNEVKGSLFEYLVAKEIAIQSNEELAFQQSFDRNYLTVLSQQDRMVRQFYPEMLPFLARASKLTSTELLNYLNEIPKHSRVVGKFSNSNALSAELFEADLLLTLNQSVLPVSLKLNKKNSFVNTKSGGIKSFFSHYFSFIPHTTQNDFNLFVDREFNRMAIDLHALHDMEYPGHFNDWVKKGLTELPGEMSSDSRQVLKNYYARIAKEMHGILSKAYSENPQSFMASLPSLMGFGSSSILQVIFFHDFPINQDVVIDIHSHQELSKVLNQTKVKDFGDISSVEIEIGPWTLQIRIKPMNKFTTTAIKINCSVKLKRPSAF